MLAVSETPATMLKYSAELSSGYTSVGGGSFLPLGVELQGQDPRVSVFRSKFTPAATFLSSPVAFVLLRRRPVLDLRRTVSASCQAQNSTRFVRLRPRRHSLWSLERVLWPPAWPCLSA